MAYSCFRFFRAIRSMLAPITAIVGFTCLLTFIFILYQPTPGPGITQKIGWQSWEIITMPEELTSTPSNHNSVPNTTHIDDNGVDWWNVTQESDKPDSTSLPPDVWAPLLPHDTGLSEIAVVRCLVDPKTADVCTPDSSREEDAFKGKWVRVDRNLNLEGGYFVGWLNIYYRRTRRRDVPLIDNIQLLADNETPKDMSSGTWTKVKVSLRSGIARSPPLYLWYHLGKTASELSTEEKSQIITELDVLYGDDVPWYGFERIEPATMAKRDSVESTWLTLRRGVKVPPRATPLHFSHEGTFKILQVADLHFSVSQGECQDTVISPCVGADNLTQSLISKVLDAEKPDLVVFTGDQLNGQGTSWDPKSVLAKFARAVTDKGVPWAAVFGNHDDEDGAEKTAQIQMMKALPFSLVERGPKDVHGVGNYVLKVKSADASKTHLLTLYFLDSGSYSKGYLDWFGFFTPTEYDWIHQDQIDWFLQESSNIDQIERPFTPDSGKDLGNAWRPRQSDQVAPDTRRLAKPNALMFFHIPIPESYNKADEDERTKQLLDIGVHGEEPPSYAKQNDGLFEKGLLRALESEHVARGNVPEVKAVANGHCHVTDNCRRVKGVWMCFGGGGSYSGYGKIGFDRRFRIYEITNYGETIATYKRTEKEEVIDKQVLSGVGAAPL